MLVIVRYAAHESLRAVGEVRGFDVFALVEQGERRDGVVAERAVVIHRSFPVEGRVVGVLHRTPRHGIGSLFVDDLAGRGVNPRIAYPRVVPVPVDVKRGIAVGGRLRDARIVGAQRNVGFQRESLGDEVEFLFEIEVGVEFVIRNLVELARRERRPSVLEVSRAVARNAASRGVGIVRVGNLVQHPCREIVRVHHRRGGIHHVEKSRDARSRGFIADAQHAAYLDRQFGCFRHVEIEVRTVVDAVVTEVGVAPFGEILEDRTLVGVSQREEVFDALGASRDVVVGIDRLGAVAHDDVEPVVVGITDRVEPRRRPGVFVDLRLGDQRAVALGVFQRHVEQRGRLRRTDVVGNFRREVEAVGERYVHARLARLSRTGGHDDDAVGSFGAEYGSRRSVFQHRDRRHLVGVEVRETAFHAVDQYQWFGAVPARNAADEDVGVVVARLAARLDGRHAREFTRNGVGDVGRAGIDELFVVHLRDGAQHALLLLHAVAHDDYVFDLVGLLGERHLQGRGVDDGYFPRLVAQERNVEYGAFADAERECSLSVGDRTAGGSSFYRDRCACDRCAVGVDDTPFGLDRRLLRLGSLFPGGNRSCRDCEQQHQQRRAQAAKPGGRY